MLSFIWDF